MIELQMMSAFPVTELPKKQSQKECLYAILEIVALGNRMGESVLEGVKNGI